jgi:hypothetical protein
VSPQIIEVLPGAILQSSSRGWRRFEEADESALWFDF